MVGEGLYEWNNKGWKYIGKFQGNGYLNFDYCDNEIVVVY